MIPPEMRAEIRRLFYAEHWKVGTIASQLLIHHDTVRKAINADNFGGRSVVRASALDPFTELIRQTLKQYPRLTGIRVHRMLKDRGYPGSVDQVRRYIRHKDLRPKPAAEAFLRLNMVPGEQAQVDWGHFGRIKIGLHDRPLYLFVVVLSWSRAVHVDFSLDQTMSSVMRGHVAAFQSFGGVARNLLYDNMKTVVLERVGNVFRFHPRLLELAGHYHFSPRPCQPGRGNEKGRVERRIRDLRSSFFAGRRFADLNDLRRQFVRWRDEVAHQRPCPADESLTVAQALEKERNVLLSLPQRPIDTDDVRSTVARKQPYVIYDTNRYSIPHQLVGRPLTLVASDKRIRVVDGNKIVAEHRRSWDRKQVIENPEHLKGLVRLKYRGGVSSGRARLLDSVAPAEALYVQLVQRNEALGANTTYLLQLLDRHGPKLLAEAIDEALRRGTPRAASVAHIIAKRERAEKRRPSLPIHLPDRPDVRGATTKTHKLEDYDELIEDRNPKS